MKFSCFLPKGDEGTDCSLQIGPFTPAFPERVIATQNLYRLSMHKIDRIAGRPAVTLSITPKLDDRYGYRVWLDKETGLMLQSHKVERGRIREIFQFSTLEIGVDIEEIDLATSIEGETVSYPLSFEFKKEQRGEPKLRVSWVPDGFKQVKKVVTGFIFLMASLLFLYLSTVPKRALCPICRPVWVVQW